MTGRTGAGVGLITTVVLTSVAAVGFFVSTLIMMNERNNAERRLSEAQGAINEIATESERNNETVRAMVNDAKKANRSLVGQITGGMGALSEKVGGTSADTLASLTAKVNAVIGDRPTNLLAELKDRDDKITALTRQFEDAEAARKRASEDLAGVQAQRQSQVDAQKTAAEAQKTVIDEYKAKIDKATADMAARVKELSADIEKINRESAEERTKLNDRLAKLADEKLVLENKLKQLTSDRARDILRPESEEALVDAEVVSVDLTSGNLTISRGRRDKLGVGMSFSVYADAAQVRVNEATGEYAPGKAIVEVIRLDDRTATARVIRSARGATINPGDVLVNPLYDPKKTYTFLVFGNFDPEGNGTATPAGAAGVRALIDQYGGKITDRLGGDVDFVVLGDRPVLPPAPPSGAAIEQVLAYREQQGVVKTYDDLYAQAAATSTPVLSENRLYTLLGATPGSLSAR